MPPAPSSDDFRAAMRGFMGHVSLVTVAETGLVVTSAISLSAEPPMILFCINRSSSTWPVLQSEGRFGWSALAHTQSANILCIQIADVTGTYGVSFLLLMFNVVIEDILACRGRVSFHARRVLWVVLFLLVDVIVSVIQSSMWIGISIN